VPAIALILSPPFVAIFLNFALPDLWRSRRCPPEFWLADACPRAGGG